MNLFSSKVLVFTQEIYNNNGGQIQVKLQADGSDKMSLSRGISKDLDWHALLRVSGVIS